MHLSIMGNGEVPLPWWERFRERVDRYMVDKLIPLAKNLRKRTTDTERLLWQHLRAKRFSGLKFRRQEPIGAYIVDFVCFDKKSNC